MLTADQFRKILAYIRDQVASVERSISSPLFDPQASSRQAFRAKVLDLIEGALIFGSNGQRAEVFDSILVSQLELLIKEGDEIRSLGSEAALSLRGTLESVASKV